MMYADTAEQTVRIILNGTEVSLRIAGNAVKNLAEILMELRRSRPERNPGSPVERLLCSGSDLRVLSMTQQEYRAFRAKAGDTFPYVPLLNRQNAGSLSVIVPEENAGSAAEILSRIPPRRGPGDLKKNGPCWNVSGKERRPSVLARLEENRRLLRRQERGSRAGRQERRSLPPATRGR